MNTIIKYTVCLMLLIQSVATFGETPSNTQRRKANLYSYQLLENLESASTISNDEAEELFRSIFKSDTINLYNDLPGLSVAERLSLDEYVELLKTVNGKKVAFKNVRGGGIEDAGDYWIVNLLFEKVIQYNTDGGAIIESSEYYDGQSYKMSAQVSIDKMTGASYILSINGDIDSTRPRLAPGFLIFEKQDKRDANLLYNKKPLVFNKYGQSFIEKPYKFSYPDDDVNLSVIENGQYDNKRITINYKPKRWRIRPNVTYALGSEYDLSENDGIESSSSNIELSVDFGYIFPSSSKLKIGIFWGVGMCKSKLDLHLDNCSYNYSDAGNGDMDGDSYIRYYEVSNVNQSIDITNLRVPLYLDMEYRPVKRLALYGQLGAYGYYNLQNKFNYSASFYCYGVYPQYGNLLIDDPSINEFGYGEYQLSNYEDGYLVESLSLDAFASIGLRISLLKQLSLDLGVSYQLPIIELFNDFYHYKKPNGSIDKYSALFRYDTYYGQEAPTYLRDHCKISKNPFKIKAGFTFKF